MLDLVPLRRPGRIVTHVEREAGEIGQLLELVLLQLQAGAAAPASVGGDHDLLRVRIGVLPHQEPPGGYALHGELASVGAHLDVDEALVAADV